MLKLWDTNGFEFRDSTRTFKPTFWEMPLNIKGVNLVSFTVKQRGDDKYVALLNCSLIIGQ